MSGRVLRKMFFIALTCRLVLMKSWPSCIRCEINAVFLIILPLNLLVNRYVYCGFDIVFPFWFLFFIRGIWEIKTDDLFGKSHLLLTFRKRPLSSSIHRLNKRLVQTLICLVERNTFQDIGQSLIHMQQTNFFKYFSFIIAKIARGLGVVTFCQK